MDIILLSFLCALMAIIFVYLFAENGKDKILHPREWSSKGVAGERRLYLSLAHEIGVPEEQIFRNVYISTKNGTTEIDLIIASRKGILVFECKNYSGNVYGDGNRKQWIQYVGRKKSYFYSPILQNRGHVKAVQAYFGNIENLPVIPFLATTKRAKWKLKNISPEDHVIGQGGLNFSDIYAGLPESESSIVNYAYISSELRKLERPDEAIRREHIERIKKN